VALADGLRQLGFEQVAVKWPNDLVVGTAKLGGLLVELGETAAGCAVIGLGLNLKLPEAVVAALDRPVTDLSRLGQVPDANALAARLAASLVATLIDFDRDGFEAWHARWSTFDALQGQRLQVQQVGGETLLGEAAGIDANGALLLRRGDEMLAIHSGEASVLPAGSGG